MGENPNEKQTPPAVQKPPAPAASAAPAAEVKFPEALGSFATVRNGVEVMDLDAVANHVTSLETFKKETIEAGRKEFVAKLVQEKKILANEETLTATESFALSLSPEQFGAWKATMDAAPATKLFDKHGVTQGDEQAPTNGAQKDREAEIKTLEEIVQSHRDSGLTNEQIEVKESYKRLQQLKSKSDS